MSRTYWWSGELENKVTKAIQQGYVDDQSWSSELERLEMSYAIAARGFSIALQSKDEKLNRR